MKYVINGSFLIERLAGVQRYAYEITKRLDKLVNGLDIEILVPDEDVELSEKDSYEQLFDNIKIVHLGSGGGKRWEQSTYADYLKNNNAKGINLCNSYPLKSKGGIVCIHDICFKTHKEFFTQPGDWHEILFRRMMYKKAFKSADKIVTVSEFSKKEMLQNYTPKKCRNIEVIGNSWQHYDASDVDEGFFDDNPDIKRGEYYFYLSSLAPNKNLNWILTNAKENPDRTYVLSGNMLGDDSGVTKLKNVIYAGYVTDAQARALMKYCRAFIFPSFYEGFGIPPMEALCMGAKVVVSDIECLREIYGDGVYYIDPYDAHIDIEQILKSDMKIKPASEVLDQYSWDKSAQKMYELIKEV